MTHYDDSVIVNLTLSREAQRASETSFEHVLLRMVKKRRFFLLLVLVDCVKKIDPHQFGGPSFNLLRTQMKKEERINFLHEEKESSPSFRPQNAWF